MINHEATIEATIENLKNAGRKTDCGIYNLCIVLECACESAMNDWERGDRFRDTQVEQEYSAMVAMMEQEDLEGYYVEVDL